MDWAGTWNSRPSLGNEPGSDAIGRAEFDEVVDWLGLAGLEAIPGSYSDLLIAKGQIA